MHSSPPTRWSELLHPSARQLAAGAAVVSLAFVWPLVSEPLVAWLGVRALACALVLVSALALLVVGRALPRGVALARGDSLALLALVGAAAATGAREFLLLVPAWVQLALARLFWRSVREGESIFERVAFALQPYAPDFIRPYCRKATTLWAGVFLANALVIAALALAGPLAWWQAFTGWIVWLAMGAISAGDYVVRKLYFRIYFDRPIDRLLARWFPAENTAMGRRANAHRREMRLALGLPP
jgi:uncharacterized membrane protein